MMERRRHDTRFSDHRTLCWPCIWHDAFTVDIGNVVGADTVRETYCDPLPVARVLLLQHAGAFQRLECLRCPFLTASQWIIWIDTFGTGKLLLRGCNVFQNGVDLPIIRFQDNSSSFLADKTHKLFWLFHRLRNVLHSLLYRADHMKQLPRPIFFGFNKYPFVISRSADVRHSVNSV